jgi:WD40 repeat protein
MGYKLRTDEEGLLYVFYPSNAFSVFDLELGECVYQAMYGGRRPYVPNEVILNNGSMILTTLTNTNIYVFSLTTLLAAKAIKKPTKIKLPKTTRVNCLAIKPETSYLCAGCTDGVIRVWNLANG